MTVAIAPARTGMALREAVERARDRAGQTGAPVPLCWTASLPDSVDPAAFFAAADPAAPRTFWFEPEHGFALVGAGCAMAFSGEQQDRFGPVSSALRSAARLAVAGGEGSPAAGPIALGGFAFDPKRDASEEWSAFPASLMAVPRALLRIENGAASVTATVLVGPEANVTAVAAEIDGLIGDAAASAKTPGERDGAAPAPVLRREVPAAGPWKSMVAEAAGDVRAGRLDKVVLARTERVECAADIDLAATLRRMATGNRTAMIFAFGVPGGVFLGASPETLVHLEDGRLQTTPLAGSIARGETPEQDEALARRLLRSRKDRIEHDVVVGAILQALDPVCLNLAPDEDAPVVVRNRTVQHLATPITGRVRPGVTAIDIAARLHPTPAVGGYPTEAALALIRSREGFDRGWYAGPIGWCDAEGDGHFCIGIRSALVRGREAILYAGCGIVADSDPETEYAETCLKLDAIGTALGLVG
jgi:salicylate biosynthesis isochorismate synthase